MSMYLKRSPELNIEEKDAHDIILVPAQRHLLPVPLVPECLQRVPPDKIMVELHDVPVSES